MLIHNAQHFSFENLSIISNFTRLRIESRSQIAFKSHQQRAISKTQPKDSSTDRWRLPTWNRTKIEAKARRETSSGAVLRNNDVGGGWRAAAWPATARLPSTPIRFRYAPRSAPTTRRTGWTPPTANEPADSTPATATPVESRWSSTEISKKFLVKIFDCSVRVKCEEGRKLFFFDTVFELNRKRYNLESVNNFITTLTPT